MAEAENYQHYQVLRREDGSLWELGKGAMGITYKAFDTNLRCTVALKVINNTYLNSEVARQRFLREARAAAQRALVVAAQDASADAAGIQSRLHLYENDAPFRRQ